MIFILGLVAILLFVLGVALLFKSYSEIPDPQNVVPAEEVFKVKKELDTSHQEEEILKLKLDALVMEIDKVKAKLEYANARGEEAEDLKSQVRGFEEKIKELTHALEYLRSKADHQAQEAVEVLTTMKEENESLRKIAQEAKNKIDPQALAQLENEKKALEEKLQSSAALGQENQKLKSELLAVNEKINQLQAELDKAVQEKEAELKKAQEAVLEFKAQIEELASQKAKNDFKLRELEEEVRRASAQLAAPQPPAGLEERQAELDKDLKALRETNARMQAREKLLQMELTKSRAQAMALEKLCAEFKEQLDQKAKSR